jgi:hypothetical protein
MFDELVQWNGAAAESAPWGLALKVDVTIDGPDEVDI